MTITHGQRDCLIYHHSESDYHQKKHKYCSMHSMKALVPKALPLHVQMYFK